MVALVVQINNKMKPKYLNIIDNSAYLRNISYVDLAKQYQTPLYVFDEIELRENMDDFLTHFQSADLSCHTVYASKALLIPSIVKICKEKGLYIDAVSLGDLYVIKESGFPMNKVVFHGNNKSIEELKFAVDNKVIIVVDHLEELIDLINYCKENNQKAKTLFRVNPGIEAHTHKYVQTSLNTSKFGESIYDNERINLIMNCYKDNKNVKLLGFHSHIGSQIFEEEPFLLNVRKMMAFSKQVENLYQYPLTNINFGGGFGIKYLETDAGLDVKSLLPKMVELVKTLNKQLNLRIKDLFIEPGRSILGNSCVTIYKCCDIKENINHHKFLFVDGGMADNIRPALYQAKYSADIVMKMNDEKNEIYDIAGKCCESGDILAIDLRLPKPDKNDYLMVYSTGAYTYSMSSNYNNMLKPAIVFVSDKPKLVVRRQELKDLMSLYK